MTPPIFATKAAPGLKCPPPTMAKPSLAYGGGRRGIRVLHIRRGNRLLPGSDRQGSSTWPQGAEADLRHPRACQPQCCTRLRCGERQAGGHGRARGLRNAALRRRDPHRLACGSADSDHRRAPPVAYPGSMRGAREAEGHLWMQQTFDQNGIVRQYIKWDHQLESQDNPGLMVSRALQVACSEPRGPVYLSLPREISLAKARAPASRRWRSLASPGRRADPKAILELVGRLLCAENPLSSLRGLAATRRRSRRWCGCASGWGCLSWTRPSGPITASRSLTRSIKPI